MNRLSNQSGFTIIELMIATSVLSIMLVVVGAVSMNVGRLYHKGVSQSKIQTASRTIADDVSKNLELNDGFGENGTSDIVTQGMLNTQNKVWVWKAVTQCGKYQAELSWWNQAGHGDYVVVETVAAKNWADSCQPGSIPPPVTSVLRQFAQSSQGKVTTGGGVGEGAANGAQAYCVGQTRYSYIVGRQLGTGNEPNADGSETAKVPHVLWRDRISAGSLCEPANMTNPPDGSEMVPDGARLLSFSISPTAAQGTYSVRVAIAYGDADLLTSTLGESARCKGSAGNEFCAKSSISTIAVKRLQ